MVIASACSDSKSDEPKIKTAPRTVLVYMVANNNLNSYALDDINEMKIGATRGLNGGRLLVYYAGRDATPCLLEITESGTEKTLVAYTDSDESSVSVARMSRVIADAKALAPARDYGLVLWSHGTGWLNDAGVIDEPQPSASTQSFGYEYGSPVKKMKITSLAQALAPNHFSFIYFDCCHMACAEVVYEMKDLTDLIVACPTELGVEGMPYDVNVPLLFEATPNLRQAVTNTFQSYTTSSEGCSISLINTASLPALASATRDIFMAVGTTPPTSYSPVRYFRTFVVPTGIFDMKDYISALNPSAQLMDRWTAAFNATVEMHLTTPTVYDLNASKFSGLGINIVKTTGQTTDYGYNTTRWWADVTAPALQ